MDQLIFEYHNAYDGLQKDVLDQMYLILKEVLPDAEETISYQMPCFKMKQPVAYYAIYKKHIGFYPTPGPIKAFEEDLKEYKTSKGAVQFKLDEPLPKALIQKMVFKRLEEIQG